MSKLNGRIRSASTADLRAIHDFFDCDALREMYTGLIADVRRETDFRATEAQIDREAMDAATQGERETRGARQ